VCIYLLRPKAAAHNITVTKTRKNVKLKYRTHTRLTALFPGPARLAGTRKVKTNLEFTEARDSERQWHQLDHMQVCTSLQTDNHASNPPLKFFTGRMPFLLPNQQRQSTEGINTEKSYKL